MRSPLQISSLLVFFLLAVSLISCTKKTTEKDLYPRSETIWVNWGSEPPTLDWTLANDIVSNNILYHLVVPLVDLDLKSDKLETRAGLFTRWQSSSDHSEWIFDLAPHFVWTDGTKLTIQHVLDGFERLLNPNTGAEGADLIFAIKGAEAYNAKKETSFEKVGIQVVNGSQVKFTLSQPLVFFPMLLTTLNTVPVRKDLIEKHGPKWTEPENMVTFGPYQLKEWQHDELIVLESNSTFAGEKPKVRFIVGRMIEELSAATELFLAKKLDYHRGLTPTDEARLEKSPELIVQNSLAVLYINFNTKLPPFDDVRARQAVVHALDRKEVLKTIGKYRKLNTNWLPDGLLGAFPQDGLVFDPAKARGLYEALPQLTREKMARLQIESNQNETHSIMLQNIQSQVKKNLKIELEIQMQDWKSYLGKIQTQPAPMFRLGFISPYPDPHFLMSLWRSNSRFNYTGWSSSRYDQILDLAAVETSHDKRVQYYREAQKILVDEAPFFNIYSAANLSLVSRRLKGFQPNPIERVDFSKVSLVAE